MSRTPPTSALPESRYRDAAGDERLVARAMWLQSAPELVCPAGHRQPMTDLSLHEFTLQCRYYPHSGQQGARCGRCVYVITDWKGADGSSFNLVVEVTSDEVRRMRRLTMAQKLAYLGLTPRGPRADQAS